MNLVVRRPDSDRVISAILAGLWAWMGIVYHLISFCWSQRWRASGWCSTLHSR